MSLIFYKYHLPFSSPLVTAKATFKFRKGYILEYVGDSFSCYGEAAPLSGFSAETLDDVRQQLISKKNELETVFSAENPTDLLNDLYRKAKVPASMQFGLDSLAHQLEAFRAGTTLQNYLFDDAPQKVPVNALVSLHSDDFLTKVEQFISQGFQTIKCKIGLKFDREKEKLEKIRAKFPKLAIRLDANQAWPVEKAVDHLSKLQQLNIEYCEEPLRNPDPNKYEELNNKTIIPLALDESIGQQNDWRSMLPFVSVLVIKPMVLGGFSKFFVTKRLAETHDNKIVLTSSLESGVGRMVTSILASGLNSLKLAQGLNTGHFLAKDVFYDKSFIVDGMYNLNYYQKWISIQTDNLQDISTTIIK